MRLIRRAPVSSIIAVCALVFIAAGAGGSDPQLRAAECSVSAPAPTGDNSNSRGSEHLVRRSIRGEVELMGTREHRVLVIDSVEHQFEVTVGYDSFLARIKTTADRFRNAPVGRMCWNLYGYLKSLPVVEDRAVVDANVIIQRYQTLSNEFFFAALADFLQEGRCRLLDKSTGKLVRRLRVYEWSDLVGVDGVRQGDGGRLFKTRGGKTVLKTVDWLS